MKDKLEKAKLFWERLRHRREASSQPARAMKEKGPGGHCAGTWRWRREERTPTTLRSAARKRQEAGRRPVGEGGGGRGRPYRSPTRGTADVVGAARVRACVGVTHGHPEAARPYS